MPFPLSPAAVLGLLGGLPATGATAPSRVGYIHAGPPVSLPITITCLVTGGRVCTRVLACFEEPGNQQAALGVLGNLSPICWPRG